jgi:hypothetical protein
VTVKPRPGSPYGLAAMASMQGIHTATVAAFDQMLREHLTGERDLTSPAGGRGAADLAPGRGRRSRA